MRFDFLFSTALCFSLAAANPVEARQNSDDIGPGDLLFKALCSEKYVLCETRLGSSAKNFCCRNGNACALNGTLITCGTSMSTPCFINSLTSFVQQKLMFLKTS